MKLGTILVPLDGLELAETAFAQALDIARGTGDPTLALLRAAEASAWQGIDLTYEQVRVIGEAETYMANVKADLARRGITKVLTSVWYGSPASAIVEAARAGKVEPARLIGGVARADTNGAR